MPARIAGALFALTQAPPAAAQEASPASDPVSIGAGIGMALFILLAVLIGLSVVAKLLIVFGIVPRQAENGLHLLVHGAANVVGGLARPKPRGPPRRRFDGQGR
jgi:hypothetical protein